MIGAGEAPAWPGPVVTASETLASAVAARAPSTGWSLHVLSEVQALLRTWLEVESGANAVLRIALIIVPSPPGCPHPAAWL